MDHDYFSSLASTIAKYIQEVYTPLSLGKCQCHCANRPAIQRGKYYNNDSFTTFAFVFLSYMIATYTLARNRALSLIHYIHCRSARDKQRPRHSVILKTDINYRLFSFSRISGIASKKKQHDSLTAPSRKFPTCISRRSVFLP